MGYMLEIVPLDKASKIRMKPDTQSIQETVVTGIFTRKKGLTCKVPCLSYPKIL